MFTVMCEIVVMIEQTLFASCIVPSTGCNTVCVFRYERQNGKHAAGNVSV